MTATPPSAEPLALDHWLALLATMGITRDRKTFRTLLARYSEPHRHYHTAAHIADCLQQLKLCGGKANRVDELTVAIYFHDAIYDTHAPDNETESAAWAQQFLRSHAMGAPAAQRVAALIRATRHDTIPTDYDQQLLVDIDLSIFGRAPEEFDRYQTQIRLEYDWVPEPVFRRRRAEILEIFLERPRLYHTDWFFAQYEAQARANLTRAVAELGGG